MGSSYVAIGYECNHNCLCCPLTTYDRLHKQLDYNEIQERIELIRQTEAVEHIVISGGEPMLHPDFLRILDFIAQKGFSITVLSNSSQCRKKEMVKSIKKYMPKNKFDIITAIHSSNPAIHDRITGVQGSLMETLEGIDNCVEEEIPVTIKHIFSRISLFTLMDTVKYLEEHYPPKVRFQFCTMDYSGRASKNIEELFISLKDIQPFIEEVLDYLEEKMVKKRNISFIETPLCLTDPYYWKYYTLASNGIKAYIAPNTDEKKVEYNVSSGCNAFYEACKRCDVQKWCQGVWKSAYKYRQEDLLRPIFSIKFNTVE